MKIQFLNHACFSVEYDDHCLLCDPYLSGNSFNDGWDLIVDNIQHTFDFKKKNYIYFSHEHPDHFSIPYLNGIQKNERSNIKIIYQNTRDKRVKKFVEKLGYKIIEVKDKDSFEIAKNFKITIGQVPFYDSWALIEVDNLKIVNANDCILETPERVYDIKKIAEKADILFTQFSYANWTEGGEENKEERIRLSNEKLRRIKLQSEVLNPKYIVPFASMVRFCHEENKYMNDSINTPEKAVEFINSNTNSIPYLMEPYEIWNGKNEKSNSESINYWKNAYKEAMARKYVNSSDPVDLKTLSSTCIEMFERVKKSKNNLILIKLLSILKFLPVIKIHLKDIKKIIKFSWHGGLNFISYNNQNDFDLEVSSDSMNFIFAHDYGVDTLNVNARFNGSIEAKKKLIRCFSILALNNTGRYVSFLGLFLMFKESNFLRHGLKTVGILK